MRRWLTGLLAFTALIGLIWAGYAYMEPRQRARAVQDELRAQRLDADACRRGLVTAEAGFREYDERVDSLRDRVDSYEALHPDGVPADSFGVYLEAFDEYNDAVEAWEERAENLRRQREACVDIVESHNELSDSLRGILREMGELEAEGSPGSPGDRAVPDGVSPRGNP